MSEPLQIVLAAVGLPFGLLLAIWPYRMARSSEIIDAIGRNPSGRVEPAEWYVFFTRGVGVVLILAGTLSAIALLA